MHTYVYIKLCLCFDAYMRRSLAIYFHRSHNTSETISEAQLLPPTTHQHSVSRFRSLSLDLFFFVSERNAFRSDGAVRRSRVDVSIQTRSLEMELFSW